MIVSRRERDWGEGYVGEGEEPLPFLPPPYLSLLSPALFPSSCSPIPRPLPSLSPLPPPRVGIFDLPSPLSQWPLPPPPPPAGAASFRSCVGACLPFPRSRGPSPSPPWGRPRRLCPTLFSSSSSFWISFLSSLRSQVINTKKGIYKKGRVEGRERRGKRERKRCICCFLFFRGGGGRPSFWRLSMEDNIFNCLLHLQRKEATMSTVFGIHSSIQPRGDRMLFDHERLMDHSLTVE